ncbi:MAG: low molecular weight protein-tyrosine-phosphatase [Aureispira sp.]
MRVLMVCLGNICRSPLAEGLLRKKVEEVGLNWEVDSAGTSAYHEGNPPDSRSIAVAKKHHLDISAQRSRPLVQKDLDDFDLIYVMDSENYNNVLNLCANEKQATKVRLIMNEVQPGHNVAVPDPYWGDDGFEQVYQMLEEATGRIVAG